jgi:Cd2+/Zn2+-exporting ATPase/Cu+-exporting ATPase
MAFILNSARLLPTMDRIDRKAAVSPDPLPN